jgi:hypothetical protein
MVGLAADAENLPASSVGASEAPPPGSQMYVNPRRRANAIWFLLAWWVRHRGPPSSG